MLIRIALSLLALLAVPGRAGSAEPRRPNVLILFADDLGYSDLGCYGGEIETPNLDRLAAGGLRFTQFYNTARCWPSRAALMTGYYAQQVRRDTVPGVKSGGQGTRPAWAPLLPARLQPLGYRNYHSGKWHIDGKPLENGFDHSFQLEDHNSYFHPANILVDGRKIGPDHRWSDQYCTVSIADHAIDCLKEHAARFSGQPFFQYVAFTAPHFPLHALPEDIARYKEKYRAGWDKIRKARYERQKQLGLVTAPLSAPESDVGPPYDFPDALQKLGPGEVNRPLPWKDLTPAQQVFQADKMAIHAAMIDRTDREIGRILEQLAAMQATEETLVLFASDNGASAEIMVRGGGHDPQASPGSDETYLCLGPGWSTCANTPFRRHKTWVHEGGIATPLIVHWPRGIPAQGELRTAPGHLIDVVPTVLALAGAGGEPSPKAPALPGRSLLPAFEANTPLERPPLWWLHEGNRALRDGDWKIVADKRDEWSLFDLASDRAETADLAKREPQRLEAMRLRWESLTEEFRRNATQEPPSK